MNSLEGSTYLCSGVIRRVLLNADVLIIPTKPINKLTILDKSDEMVRSHFALPGRSHIRNLNSLCGHCVQVGNCSQNGPGITVPSTSKESDHVPQEVVVTGQLVNIMERLPLVRLEARRSDCIPLRGTGQAAHQAVHETAKRLDIVKINVSKDGCFVVPRDFVVGIFWRIEESARIQTINNRTKTDRRSEKSFLSLRRYRR